MSQRIINKLLDKGVDVIDPTSTYISENIQIEKGCVIYPNTFLKGNVKIGKNNELGPNLHIEGKVVLGKNNKISYSHIENSKIGDNNIIGPYARIRDHTVVKNNARVGNFVEIKNSEIGNTAQIAHLSYIGDSILGKNVNIGAGTITANYDSVTGKKSKTVIKDNASTGSNSVLIAPVKIGENALIAAGSVITKDVPAGSLSITRVDQQNKTHWVKEKLKKFNKTKSNKSKNK